MATDPVQQNPQQVHEGEHWLTDASGWNKIFDSLEIEKTHHYNYNPHSAKRVLAVCRGGNCRSTAAGFLLKYKYKLDALAISLEKNSGFTWGLLIGWADHVLTFDKRHHDETITLMASMRAIINTREGVPPISWPSLMLCDLGDEEKMRVTPFDIDFLKKVDSHLSRIINQLKG